MPEETNSVRVTNAAIYAQLLDLQKTQIQIVAEMRNLANVPSKVAEIDTRLAKVELVSKLMYTAITASVGAIAVALIGVTNV